MSHGHSKSSWSRARITRLVVFYAEMLLVVFCTSFITSSPTLTRCWQLLAVFIVVKRSVKSVPPVHLGTPTLFHGRTGEIVHEGFVLLPWPYDVLAVNIELIQGSIEFRGAFTPIGNTEILIKLEIDLVVDEENLEKFQDAGGRDRVLKAVTDLMVEAYRYRVNSQNKSPKKWQDVITMGVAFQAVVLRPLFQKNGGRETRTLKEVAETLRGVRGGPPLRIPDLGIMVTRVNVTELGPANPEIIKAAERYAIEELEQISEGKNVTTVLEQVTKMCDALKARGFSINPTEILQRLQVERGIVTEKIQTTKLDIPPGIIDVLERLLGPKIHRP